jgi:hypothetical protein
MSPVLSFTEDLYWHGGNARVFGFLHVSWAAGRAFPFWDGRDLARGGELGITNGFPLCTGGFPWRGVGPSAYLSFFLAFSRLPASRRRTQHTNDRSWFFKPPSPYAVYATRTDALASGIGAFAEVHAGLGGVPVRIPTMIHTLIDASHLAGLARCCRASRA